MKPARNINSNGGNSIALALINVIKLVEKALDPVVRLVDPSVRALEQTSMTSARGTDCYQILMAQRGFLSNVVQLSYDK